MQTESNTLKELAEHRQQTRAQASAKGKDEELPEGAAPIEAQAAASAEEGEETSAAPPAEPEPEELIRIGDREFRTQSEAIKYAEHLEAEKLAAEAYSQGIRDTLHQTGIHNKPTEPEVDNFDEQFYSNPKEALRKVKEEAKAEALAVVDAQAREEKAWKTFSETYPELADSRREVERILQENWAILGKMTDSKKAMEILATKTRSYFQDIADRIKPRAELPKRAGQVVSTGTGAAPRVTPEAKVEKALDFVSEMKKLREHR